MDERVKRVFIDRGFTGDYTGEPVYTSMAPTDLSFKGYILWLPNGDCLVDGNGAPIVFPTLDSCRPSIFRLGAAKEIKPLLDVGRRSFIQGLKERLGFG